MYRQTSFMLRLRAGEGEALEALHTALRDHRTDADAARALGISPRTLSRWLASQVEKPSEGEGEILLDAPSVTKPRAWMPPSFNMKMKAHDDHVDATLVPSATQTFGLASVGESLDDDEAPDPWAPEPFGWSDGECREAQRIEAERKPDSSFAVKLRLATIAAAKKRTKT